MKKKIYGFLCFSCAMLTGCPAAFHSVQDAPEGVPRAKLRVIGDGLVQGYSKGVRGATIVGPSVGVGSSGLSGRSLEMPNPERIVGRHFAEFYIEAKKPFTLFFDSKVYDFYCYIRGSFVPVEGKNYEASVQLLYNEIRFGMGTDKICVIDVFVLSEDGQWEPVRVFR